MYHSDHILGLEVFLLQLYVCNLKDQYQFWELFSDETWNEKNFTEKAPEATRDLLLLRFPLLGHSKSCEHPVLREISRDVKGNSRGKDQANVWTVSHVAEEED